MKLFYGWIVVAVGIVVACVGFGAAGGWLYDVFGSYFWLFLGSSGIGLGAVAIGLTFRPTREAPVALPSPSVAH